MLHFPTSCYLSVNFSMPREDEMSSGKNGGRYKDDSTNISGVWTTFMRAGPSLKENKSLDSIREVLKNESQEVSLWCVSQKSVCP